MGLRTYPLLVQRYPPLLLSLAVLVVAVVVGSYSEASPRVLVDETGAPDSVTALLRKNCCCLCTLCSCCPLAADAWLFRAGFVVYIFRCHPSPRSLTGLSSLSFRSLRSSSWVFLQRSCESAGACQRIFSFCDSTSSLTSSLRARV